VTDAEETPRYRDPEWLREQYVMQDCTIAEIAARTGVHRKTVREYLYQYGLETPPDDNPTATVREAVEAAFAHDETLPGAAGVPVRAIMARVELARSTVDKHLHELAEAGAVVKGRGFDPHVDRPVTAWVPAEDGGEEDG
jgi:predicted ArsR family transcriptional regulator